MEITNESAIELEFITRVGEYLNSNNEEISKEIIRDFFSACENVFSFQQNEQTVPIGLIAFNYSETEYYFGNYIINLGFYEENSLMENPFYEQKISISGLKYIMNEFSKDLLKYKRENNKSDEWYRLKNHKLFQDLIELFSYYLKYKIREACEQGCIDKLFYIEKIVVSIGQYLEWQIPVYQVSDTIDIFDDDTDKTRRFRKYSGCVYRKKSIAEMDFSGSIFIDCVFDNCNIKSSIFHDVTFRNCSFTNIKFVNDSMCGVIFEECKISNVTATNVSFDIDETDECFGLFREAEIINCVEESNELFATSK